MSQTAVLVWLSASSVLPTFRADLAAFAQSRLLRFEPPHENAGAFRASAYAPDVVAQVESSLEEARNATASLEQSQALAALERADRLLREHPELPQSAWLMAEVLELSADVESPAPDGAEAAGLLRQRAAALAGPRAAPFSDRAPSSDVSSSALAAVVISGLEPGDELEWDGIRAQSPLSAAPGEHHARVLRNERLLWAGWTKVGLKDTELHLPVPGTVPCSGDDLVQGHFAGGRAVPAPNARCDSYVLARARSGGGIEAALCERASCGGMVIWENVADRAATRDEPKKIWPYAVAISAGALLATGLVLWRVGAFDRPDAATTSSWVLNPKQSKMGLSF